MKIVVTTMIKLAEKQKHHPTASVRRAFNGILNDAYQLLIEVDRHPAHWQLETGYRAIQAICSRAKVHGDHHPTLIAFERAALSFGFEHGGAMLSVADAKRRLNSQSEFSLLAQYAIELYYLHAFPNAQDNRLFGEINRKRHGGVHVCRSAIVMECWFEIYDRYIPGKLNLDLEEKTLLKLAMIYHDAANQNDHSGGQIKEADHAAIFKKDMLAWGFNPRKVQVVSAAMAKKDDSPASSIFQKLIHDADCLDVIRVLGVKNFQAQRLYILQDAQLASPAMTSAVEAIVEGHIDLIDAVGDKPNGNKLQHRQCEFSVNCYESVRATMEDFILDNLCARYHTFYPNQPISVDWLDKETCFKHLSFLDGLLIWQMGDDALKTLFNKIGLVLGDMDTEPVDAVKGGSPGNNEFLFIRCVSANRYPAELISLQRSAEFCQQRGLNSAADLRLYVYHQEGELISRPGTDMHQHFRWFPATLVGGKIPVKIGTRFGSAGLVIKAKHPGVYAPFSYKMNVMSNQLSHSIFDYSEPQIGCREQQTKKGIQCSHATIDLMINKLKNMDERRRGLVHDHSAAYYGLSAFAHNENLLHYAQLDEQSGSLDLSAISHIFIEENLLGARHGLRLRLQLGKPWRPFVLYQHQHGFTLISDSEVFSLAKSKGHPVCSLSSLASSSEDCTDVLTVPLLEIDNYHHITITSSLEKGDLPGVVTPLRFTFAHPINDNITCIASVEPKQGQPLIEFYRGDVLLGASVHSHLVNKICHYYYSQQIDILNNTILRHPRFYANFSREFPLITLKYFFLQDKMCFGAYSPMHCQIQVRDDCALQPTWGYDAPQLARLIDLKSCTEPQRENKVTRSHRLANLACLHTLPKRLTQLFIDHRKIPRDFPCVQGSKEDAQKSTLIDNESLLFSL